MFQTNYKEQLQIAYRTHRLVPFVGSGLSVPFQMPKWKDLLKDIVIEYNTYPVDKNKLNEALDEYRYLDAIDCIMDAGVDELDLQRSVAKFFESKLSNISELQIDNNYTDLLRAKCSKYITTNYDNILSNYIGHPPRRIEMLGEDFINEWDSGHYENFVFNIHGDYTNPSSIILSRESYRKLYSDYKYKNILEMFKYKYTFLFMGFSMDDEFVQGIFSRELSKFPTRHYIILSNVDEEKRRSIEKKFNVRVISYNTENNEDHVKKLRSILEEIQSLNEIDIVEYVKTNPMFKATGPLSVKDSTIKNQEFSQGNSLNNKHLNELTSYDQMDYIKKTEEIEVLLKKKSYSDALAQYLLLQSELFGLKVTNDINLRIYKGILTCRIALRKYDEVQRMLPQISIFEKGSFETQLYPILLDFFINTGRTMEAYNSIKECLNIEPSNVIFIGMLYYINAMRKNKPWNEVKKLFVDENWNLIITAGGELVKDSRDKAYLFRVLGEIALIRKEHLSDAKKSFEISLEYEKSIEILEDLGMVMYAIALDKADDGKIIRIQKINQKQLKEAIYYFESALEVAKDVNIVLSRIAPIYLRSLFYIGNYGRFDDIVEMCSPYLYDDTIEISRMCALVCISLGKSPEKFLPFVGEEDKRVITYQEQFKDGDYEEILAYGDSNIDKLTESDYYAILDAAFFLGDLEKYNSYYQAFIGKFPNANNMLIIEAFKHEINGHLEQAEKYFVESANIESPMTVNVLLGFYKRRENHAVVKKIYEELLGNETLIERINYDGLYFSYHEYLMSINHREEAVWLYINHGKDKLSIYIEHVILIDLKVYLHDGNDLIAYCLEIDAAFHKFGEKIYNFYAALGYLMETDLINARRYINKYKKDGYTDDRSIQLIKELEARLLALEGKRNPLNPEGLHIIRKFSEKVSESNHMIRIHPDYQENCVMDSSSLYLFISRGMKYEIKKIKNILISHSTIELIQFAFMETGDRVLIEILDYISESNNVTISSPDIKLNAETRKCFKFNSNDVATISTTSSVALALDYKCGYISAFRLFEGIPDTIHIYEYEFLEKNMKAISKDANKKVDS